MLVLLRTSAGSLFTYSLQCLFVEIIAELFLRLAQTTGKATFFETQD